MERAPSQGSPDEGATLMPATRPPKAGRRRARLWPQPHRLWPQPHAPGRGRGFGGPWAGVTRPLRTVPWLWPSVSSPRPSSLALPAQQDGPQVASTVPPSALLSIRSASLVHSKRVAVHTVRLAVHTERLAVHSNRDCCPHRSQLLSTPIAVAVHTDRSCCPHRSQLLSTRSQLLSTPIAIAVHTDRGCCPHRSRLLSTATRLWSRQVDLLWPVIAIAGPAKRLLSTPIAIAIHTDRDCCPHRSRLLSTPIAVAGHTKSTCYGQ